MADVIIENRQSGERRVVTQRAANLLNTKFKIVGESNGKTIEKDPNFKSDNGPKSELEKLRAEYQSLFGKPAHHLLKEAKLKELISQEINK